MHQRKPGLVPYCVIAPDFGDVDGVFGRQPASHINATGRDIQMKRHSRAAKVCPLSHRFEVVDRFCCLHLDRAYELSTPLPRRENQVREDLNLPDADRHGLIFSDIGDYLMLALQLDLKESDDPIVLELLADGPHQDWAHLTSRTRQYSESRLPENREFQRRRRQTIRLTYKFFELRMMPVIAPAEPSPAKADTRAILIVDDDPFVADTFARMLKIEGFEVATALSAEAGLELANTVTPDAIILDMRMPITNGLQFLRLLRTLPRLSRVPVAIVTGDYFLSPAVQHELRALGAAIRLKPLWLEDLIALAKSLTAA